MKITFKIPVRIDKDIDKIYKFKTTGKIRKFFLYPLWPISRKLIKYFPRKYRKTTYTIKLHTDCDNMPKK